MAHNYRFQSSPITIRVTPDVTTFVLTTLMLALFVVYSIGKASKKETV